MMVTKKTGDEKEGAKEETTMVRPQNNEKVTHPRPRGDTPNPKKGNHHHAMKEDLKENAPEMAQQMGLSMRQTRIPEFYGKEGGDPGVESYPTTIARQGEKKTPEILAESGRHDEDPESEAVMAEKREEDPEDDEGFEVQRQEIEGLLNRDELLSPDEGALTEREDYLLREVYRVRPKWKTKGPQAAKTTGQKPRWNRYNHVTEEMNNMHEQVMNNMHVKFGFCSKAGLTFKAVYEGDPTYTKWLLTNENKLTDPQLLHFVKYAKDRQALNKQGVLSPHDRY